MDEPVDGQPRQQIEPVAAPDEARNFEGGRGFVADELDSLGEDVRPVISEAVGLPLLK